MRLSFRSIVRDIMITAYLVVNHLPGLDMEIIQPRFEGFSRRNIDLKQMCWLISVKNKNLTYIVASELKDPIWHPSEWQIGSFSSEATI